MRRAVTAARARLTLFPQMKIRGAMSGLHTRRTSTRTANQGLSEQGVTLKTYSPHTKSRLTVCEKVDDSKRDENDDRVSQAIILALRNTKTKLVSGSDNQ